MFRIDDQAVAHSQLSAFRQWCEARTGQILPDHAAMDRFRWRSSAASGASSWSGATCLGRVRSSRSVSAMSARPPASSRISSQLRRAAPRSGSPDWLVLTAVTPRKACHPVQRAGKKYCQVAVAGGRRSCRWSGWAFAVAIMSRRSQRNNAERAIAAWATTALGANFRQPLRA